MEDFSGKLAVITGGSSGIGFSTAQILARQGCHVVILARRVEQLNQALEALQDSKAQPNQRIESKSVNVADWDATQKTFAEIETTLGTPDILINSAGVTRPGMFDEQEINIFRDMMEINYFGTLYPIKAVLPGMLKRGSGHITLISSVAGFAGIYGYAAYGASKYAVVGLADVLRVELKPRNIHLSLVFPPDTNTPQLAGEERYKPALTKALSESNARVLEPETVAEKIVDAIRRNKYLVLPPGETRLLYGLVSTLGLWRYPIMDMFLADAAKKMRKQKNKAK